jgi:hypothetical protein
MKSYFISMFIDDELDIDQKVELIEAVSGDSDVKQEVVNLLEQEKRLRSDMVDFVPPMVIAPPHRPRVSFFRAIGLFSSGLATALTVFLAWTFFEQKSPDPLTERPLPYRFVVYQPQITHAEITGSFTRWQKVPMIRNGDYWEVTLDLHPGEHRFSYIFDGNQKVADPTVAVREKDDFGGENSILEL